MTNKWWLDLRNRLDYFLRQSIRWRLPGKIKPHSTQTELFDGYNPADRHKALALAEEMANIHHLSGLKQTTSIGNYQENLFYLHMLKTVAEKADLRLPNPLDVIDIGPSHWFYVQALYAFCSWHQTDQARTVHLTGYEADPYRVYANLHSRFDHAMANIGDLPDVNYIPRPFTPIPHAADLITLFFPFVFDQDHLEWGLPRSVFQPQDLLSSAWKSLKPGGRLLVVNQGEAEHRQEMANLSAISIPVCTAFQMDNLLFKYNLDRYILVSKPYE